MRPHIERVIDDFGYDFSYFTLDGFVQHLVQTRHRPIILVPFELSVDTSGAYIKCPSRDYILYSACRHKLLQTHTILHELGHMLLGHRLHVITVHGEPRMATLRDIPARFRFNQPRQLSKPEVQEEQEAEFFVRLIQTKVAHYKNTTQLYSNQLVLTTIPPFSIRFDKD